MLRFRHPNLMTLMGYCVWNDNFCLVHEFMSNGSLGDALANSVCFLVLYYLCHNKFSRLQEILSYYGKFG